ncbi:MAG TPA: NUDIX domain-containing protein, partial [Steroidobacteraceae bacterium]|nr:NUDIX domain-containing protein [Steroidobacteraceae bacterium]
MPREKVVAYITHRRRLLVFAHRDFPEAGIQVPAGTLEPGETGEAAVLREAREESGLDDLALVRYLGERWLDMTPFGRDEVLHRRFYHLRCLGEPPETWLAVEEHPSGGETEPIYFECFWAPLPDGVPELGDLGALLPQLLA